MYALFDVTTNRVVNHLCDGGVKMAAVFHTVRDLIDHMGGEDCSVEEFCRMHFPRYKVAKVDLAISREPVELLSSNGDS